MHYAALPFVAATIAMVEGVARARRPGLRRFLVGLVVVSAWATTVTSGALTVRLDAAAEIKLLAWKGAQGEKIILGDVLPVMFRPDTTDPKSAKTVAVVVPSPATSLV